MTTSILSKALGFFHPIKLHFRYFQQLNSSPCKTVQALSVRTISSDTESHESLPVWSCNEWDPLKEVVVGRAEGQRVPFLHTDFHAKTEQSGIKWIRENAGKPHDSVVVQKAIKEVEEFCRILQHEGVVVKRPEPMRWDEMGTFRTPYFEEGGYMNACPRDGLLVVADEIIEAPMAWRSRVFEFYPYKKMMNEYFHRGAKWTAGPRPAMGDDLFVKDFPYDDLQKREEMMQEGQFILTEAEVAMDGADAMRFGYDVFVTLSHATNRSGVKWLRRHLEPKGIRVHSVIVKDILSCHADATFLPLRPGLLLVNPTHPCLKIDDEPAGWEYFKKRGWDVVESPPPVNIDERLGRNWNGDQSTYTWAGRGTFPRTVEGSA